MSSGLFIGVKTPPSSRAAFSAAETECGVNVQLIDAETGSHLWAERFDKPLADLFDMQDEIAARLAGALNAQVIAPRPDARNRRPTGVARTFVFQEDPTRFNDLGGSQA